MDTSYLPISGIQHFCFCRRQWALIHIEQQWQENVLTAEGRIDHERVHDSTLMDSRNGILAFRGMQIKSDRLQISGVCDAVEFVPDKEGFSLHGYEGLWRAYPVEYKHGSSKANDCDRLQAVAQAICLEEMFCCHISEAQLFYEQTRRREKIVIDSALREKLEAMIQEMQAYYQRGYTPKVKPTKGCYNCSLSDLCLPVLMKQANLSAKKYVDCHLKEGLDEE